MTSIARVDKIQKVADSSNIINKTGTDITLGQTGDDIIVPAGATITNNGTAVGFDTDTNDKVKVTTNDTTAGFLTSKILAGTNITLATGSPGGNETLTINNTAPIPDPPIAWQSSIITATTLTAVAGKGYWIDTTSNACTITLPASASVGDQIIFVDYARRWGINAITINQNSLNFQGSTSPNPVYSTAGQTLNIVYSGATRGWTPISDDAVQGTGAGGFPDYTGIAEVVAGGGSGGNESGGGGGAGGFQSSSQTFSSGDIIAITVGAGGASVTGNNDGNNGGASSMTSSGLTDVTSAGGGNGGTYNGTAGAGGSGGGGGGGGNPTAGGAGNTPSTSPSQGNSGGNGVWTGSTYRTTGGGGGISAVGVAGNGGTTMGNGGAGKTNSLGVAVCGGGGGGANAPLSAVTVGTGGTGGGGLGGSSGINGTNGTTGTGGGGGGGGVGSDFSGAGGKGYVSLTIPVAYYSGSYNGFPVVDIGSTNVTLTFSGTGSYIV